MEHAFNTGAIPKKDYRNFTIKEVEDFLPQAPVVPVTYIPDISKFPIFYQGKIGSCVGHAAAWLKMWIDKNDTQKVIEYSPRFVYTMCKSEDGIPDIEGTHPIVACKVLKNYGVCPQSILPNDVDMTHTMYKAKANITPEVLEAAEDAKISAYAEVVDRSFNNLKAEIFRSGVVMLCIKHGGEFYTTPSGEITWDKNKLFPLKKISPLVSGHEVVAYGYDEDNIYFVNSFGDKWGKKGIGWFGADYVDRVKEAHVVVDLPNWKIAELREKRKSIMYQTIALLKQLVDLLIKK